MTDAGIKTKSSKFYLWLKRNNFPPGYQVLCWNCNCGRSINNGICPHKTEREYRCYENTKSTC